MPSSETLSTTLRNIFIKDIPLMDLRAPVEFAAGAFPESVNFPLMTDDERKKVGTCYKHYGQDAAIKLGHKLVSGEIKEHRLQKWQNFCQKYPQGHLYCFRGGLRSKTVQSWLFEAGIDYPLIEGGYKAMRRFLIDSLDRIAKEKRFIVIGGRTGTRKTDLITSHVNTLDLEGRANHRGSSFGRRVGGQPSIINFENHLAVDLLKVENDYNLIFIEDEGVTVGSCSIPLSLRNTLQDSEVILVEASLEDRIENILKDYVLSLSKEYLQEDAEQGYENYRKAMLSSLKRIKKRLGGERYQQIYLLLSKALASNESLNESLHRDWIRQLLADYYDPMYDFQIKGKQHRVIDAGNWQYISNLMKDLTTTSS